MFATQAIAVMAFTAVAVVCDLRTRRIPNGLNVLGLLTGVIYCVATRGWSGFQFSISGFFVGFGILFLLWIIGAGGGGDVKLMGAVGAWLGPTLVLIVFVLSGVLAGLGQLCRFIWIKLRKTPDPSGQSKLAPHGEVEFDQVNSEGSIPRPSVPSKNTGRVRQKLPYAVPVAIAVWIVCGLKLVHLFSGGKIQWN